MDPVRHTACWNQQQHLAVPFKQIATSQELAKPVRSGVPGKHTCLFTAHHVDRALAQHQQVTTLLRLCPAAGADGTMHPCSVAHAGAHKVVPCHCRTAPGCCFLCIICSCALIQDHSSSTRNAWHFNSPLHDIDSCAAGGAVTQAALGTGHRYTQCR